MKRWVLALCIAGCAWGSAPANDTEPAGQIDGLMRRLIEGRVDGAFTGIFAGSLVEQQKPGELRSIEVQAKNVFELFGSPRAYELIDTERLGESLVRLRWITRHADEAPLFWRGLFYRRHGRWEPLLIAFFDDPARVGF